jgi:His/Glu/Gln/Arg/opine family amino acid ABC transporter permease subunit
MLVDNFAYLASGAMWTVALALSALVTAVLLGILAGIARLYGPRLISLASTAYIELFRGTPVLVQMFFVFFGLPLALGWNISAFASATFALTLNSGAYFAEIVRGGLQSIPRGQWTAGFAMGLTFRQVLQLVVAPQALRRILPPAVGQFTILVKDTSVASIVGFFELTKAGQHVVERTLASFEIFALVGLMYFVVCYSGSVAARALEGRFAGADGGKAGTMWRYRIGS